MFGNALSGFAGGFSFSGIELRQRLCRIDKDQIQNRLRRNLEGDCSCLRARDLG